MNERNFCIHILKFRWLAVACLMILLPASDRLSAQAVPTTSVSDPAATPQYRYELLRTLPKPQPSFTQGLAVDGGQLLESSGGYDKSFVQRVQIPGISSKALIEADILHQHRLPRNLFAEGLAVIENRVFVLTWKRGQLLRFERQTLQPLPPLRYRGEGWGLTSMDHTLVMSDGSDQLHWHSTDDFRRLRSISVREQGQPLQDVNDLAYDGQHIWANLWMQSRLIAIDPDSGTVTGELSLQALVNRENRQHPDEVLNGLAWDPQQQALWVTGKYWHNYYLLRLIPPPAADKTF